MRALFLGCKGVGWGEVLERRMSVLEWLLNGL
jgi:hypothetical protein